MKGLITTPGRVHWLLGAALGLVFLYASVDKIQAPREFARIIYRYQMIGPNTYLDFRPANTLAITLPWVEVVLGVLLVGGVWRREAAFTAACLLVMFLIAVGYALSQGIDIENCGCFVVAGEGRRAGAGLIAADLGMLVTALFLAFAPPPLPGANRD